MKLVPEEAVAKPEIAERRPRPAGGLNFTSLAALYVLTIRQHLHGRRWIVMAALFLLPAGLSILIRAAAPEVPAIGVEFMIAFVLIP